MTAVNCQDKPAVAPPFGVVRDDAEGKLAGESGGLAGAYVPHFSGECSAPLPIEVVFLHGTTVETLLR